MSDRDTRYGHVGVVVAGADGLAIIHAAGDPTDRGGHVRADTLDTFLARSERAGLYRPNISDAQRATYLGKVEAAENARRPFDRDYAFGNDALYCTELPWMALSDATGRDAVPDKTGWLGKQVIALDDLQYAEDILPVLHVDIENPGAGDLPALD